MPQKFRKLVAIEPIHLWDYAEKALCDYADEVILHDDLPDSDDEIVRRVGDADAMLVSYTTHVSGDVIKRCPNLKYIGLCCSLYSPSASHVDILTAEELGIKVTGVRDYGDEGVAEFVVHELVRLLHGYGDRRWDSESREITGLKVGIIGMGVTGTVIADALRFFGADLSYYSRTRKPEAEKKGVKYLELNNLVADCEVLCTCLNKNVVLLHEEQFSLMNGRKIIFNTVGSPTYDTKPLKKLLDNGSMLICDLTTSVGDTELFSHPNVRCTGFSAGLTLQARKRLSDKVLLNLKSVVDDM